MCVQLVPGETALAFYTAKNLSKNAVTGVATYNVSPDKSGNNLSGAYVNICCLHVARCHLSLVVTCCAVAGIYFNKIQCFCFEEQRLGPLEEIDMPVFFYLDPDLMDDIQMKDISEITLSYTFFCTGMEAPEEEEESTKALVKVSATPPSVVSAPSNEIDKKL